MPAPEAGRASFVRPAALGLALAVAFALAGPPSAGHATATESEADEEAHETMRAQGTFKVKMGPLDTYTDPSESKIGRMSIDKTFAGDLDASSRGEMLSGGSPAEGSAGYVAIERVTGTLHGREGSFLLQHSGSMSPGSQELTITIVPGSGTGALEGLAGSMSIEIDDGRHAYELEYTLPGGE